MNETELQKRYNELLQIFNDGHKKLVKIKKEIHAIRVKLNKN